MLTYGNSTLLDRNPFALFCSREIPLAFYYPAVDFITALMQQPLTIASGWQSTVEKRALKTRDEDSSLNIIFFLAKGIDYFMLPKNLKTAFDNNHVLIISKCKDLKRPTPQSVKERNQLILASCNRFIFLHINSGGNLESLFHEAQSLHKQIFIFDHFTNRQWSERGAIPISINVLSQFL